MSEKRPFILSMILVSMMGCISLWFAGNAVVEDLQVSLSLPSTLVGFITSAIHLGFITGTLLFAYWAISDRFAARLVYFVCAIVGAVTNLLIFFAGGLTSLIVLRFITGVMLAGIYPVGMKIAFSWYHEDIGKVLGYLLGAFTIGTALPHLLKALGHHPDWRMVLIAISLLTVMGGILMVVFVPDGPYLPKRAPVTGNAIVRIFKSREIRRTAFGYFGHMWELYSFWVFVPFIIIAYTSRNNAAILSIPLWTFLIISSGSLGCVLGGFLSGRMGSARVAFIQLALSGVCCLLSPFLLNPVISPGIFLSFLIIWGITVVGDSPQYSALISHHADKELVGTSLTIVNCIGFFISIVSIELINHLVQSVSMRYVFLFLAPGPLLGLAGLAPIVFSRKPGSTEGLKKGR